MCVHLALNPATVSPVGRDTIAGLPSGSFADTHLPTWVSATLASAELAGGGEAGVLSFFEELGLQAANATAPAPAAPAARTERPGGGRARAAEATPAGKNAAPVSLPARS